MKSGRGVTLLELLVVLAIIGVISTVAVAAFPGVMNPKGGEIERSVQTARHRAARSGRPVRVTVPVGDRSVHVTALPDGRVIAARAIAIDPLTGASHAPR